MTEEDFRSEPDQPIGPPAKFDAEPVRRRSKRWIWMLLALFLTIVGTVGIAVWQFKEYRANAQARRLEQAKTDQESHALPKTRRVFDLPETESTPTPVQATVPAGVMVPPLADAGAAPPLPRPTGAATAAPPMQPVEAPTRRSMFVEVEAPGAATAAAQVATAPPAASSATTGSSAAQRAKSVQEQARRTAGNSLTGTAQALAANLGNRNYLLARGSTISCGLQTQLESNVPGEVNCITSQDAYSDDGRVVLIEKGSLVTGEFKNTMKNGDRRIGIIWSRIKTPNGVVIDVDSPATDSVGASGVDGHVDNHWWDRIGAAFLLSLVDDAVAYQTAKQGAEAATASGASQPYQQTTGTTKRIAEKVLDSTINIPPTLSRNRGHRLLIMVKRDLWFDQVYEVRAR